MQYRVNCIFGRGASLLCAQFKDLADARVFIEQKLKLDANLKLEVTYRIYEFDELVKEYPPIKEGDFSTQSQEKSSTGSQGKSSTASFKPTPFNTSPRPSGTPPRWIIEPDDNDDDTKK